MDKLQYFVAGWGAGAFGIIVGYPMDTIKTYQQLCNEHLPASKAINLILKKEGLRGLYKGMFFPLMSAGILNSVYFGVCHASLALLQSMHGNNTVSPINSKWMQDVFFAGTIGGGIQAFVSCPTELIKIRMQVGEGLSKKTTKCKTSNKIILPIYRRFGIRGFFLGLVPTICRDSLHGGIYIFSYQYIRHYMHGELNLNPGMLETFVASGCAGVLSWIPVIPFDTVKSRIQGDHFVKPKYNGMVNCSVRLYRDQHIYSFYKGFSMITIRSLPVNITIWCSYEGILWCLELI